MKILKEKCVNLVILLLGLILSLTPFMIAPVCPAMANGMRMSCYYSGLLATYVGIAVVIISLISIFVKNKVVNIVLNVINILCGLSVHLIPNKIIKIVIGTKKDGTPKFMGYCMKDTMQCISNHTFTIVSILGIAISVISLVYIVYIFIKKEN